VIIALKKKIIATAYIVSERQKVIVVIVDCDINDIPKLNTYKVPTRYNNDNVLILEVLDLK
jgi:hypothetical protein